MGSGGGRDYRRADAGVLPEERGRGKRISLIMRRRSARRDRALRYQRKAPGKLEAPEAPSRFPAYSRNRPPDGIG
jgi:hypothetical protein